MLTSVLGGGTAVVFGVAAWPVALVDTLTGGNVQKQLTTGMESIVVGVEGLITGDTRGIERLSDEIHSGERGIIAQGLGVVGDQALAGPMYVAGEGVHQMYNAITTGDTSGLDMLSDQIARVTTVSSFSGVDRPATYSATHSMTPTKSVRNSSMTRSTWSLRGRRASATRLIAPANSSGRESTTQARLFRMP